MAWKPNRVQSRRTVASVSSSPRPAYVRISGYAAARGASMIEDSQISKRANLPSGMGIDSSVAAPVADRPDSAGAARRTVSRVFLSIRNDRNASGCTHRSPPTVARSLSAMARQTPSAEDSAAERPGPVAARAAAIERPAIAITAGKRRRIRRRVMLKGIPSTARRTGSP